MSATFAPSAPVMAPAVSQPALPRTRSVTNAESLSMAEQAAILRGLLRDERRQPLVQIAHAIRSISRKIIPLVRTHHHLRVGSDLHPVSQHAATGIDWLGHFAPIETQWTVTGPAPRLWIAANWTPGILKFRLQLAPTTSQPDSDGDSAPGTGAILALAADGIHSSEIIAEFPWRDTCEITITLSHATQAIAIQPPANATFQIQSLRLALRG
ncbi:hypothetical protein [Tuwongella immobilis]|uniref:Uncharacterized protein n=1 Tax=Tuwongella immobilis TaxID=692036 RepID=A0A6C2YVY6_9BACT|nr:hypothetical protein [Tuwongella immobilis]VIP05790.1 unnamed protein product [Tuwongella immobilis]VTS08936.1 unnamed protein product [Tuwongella immobilis]